jgi:hypothetical protein
MTFDGTCERGGVQRAPQEIEERSPGTIHRLCFWLLSFVEIVDCRLQIADFRLQLQGQLGLLGLLAPGSWRLAAGGWRLAERGEGEREAESPAASSWLGGALAVTCHWLASGSPTPAARRAALSGACAG